MDDASTRKSPEFETLDRALVGAYATAGAAEAHGILCGRLCVPERFDLEDYIEDMLGSPADESDAAQRCAKLLRNLVATTGAQMHGTAFDLDLLLPPDDRPLAERAQALSEWCEGFIYGFALTGAGGGEPLRDEGGEFLSDLYSICRMDTSKPAGSEREEEALMQLAEYVRMGVFVVRDQVSAAEMRGDNEEE